MKKVVKIVTSILLACSLFLNMSSPVYANDVKIENRMISREDMPEDVKAVVAELISYYADGYRADVLKCLNDLKVLSSEYYEIWNSIINYWDWIEEDMVDNINVAPDGIQNPKKHAFIVLGFALNSDGTMKDELVGRLQVAKASADKYPDSYVLVTGGVNKNGWTEGRRMRDWLKANGIAEERIIVEEKAPDTAGNATNSFEMLYNDYDVESVSLISSQYHIKRGSILYYTESLLKAHELGVKPIKYIGEANAGWYRADLTSESMAQKANSLRSVAHVPYKRVTTSIMTGIKISGKTEYVQGEPLALSVLSVDDKNYDVDLTKYTTLSGFDSQLIGDQSVVATFVQGGKSFVSTFQVHVSKAPDPIDPDLEKALADIDSALLKANELKQSEYTQKSWEEFSKSLALLKKARLENPTKETAIAALQTYNVAYEHFILGKTGHTATKVNAKAATTTETGNITYWHCEVCDRYYDDEALTKEISKEKTILAKVKVNEVVTGDYTNISTSLVLLLVSAGFILILRKKAIKQS